MQVAAIFKFIGLLLIIFSFSQLPPIVVDLIYQQQQALIFLVTFFITFISGIICYLPFKNNKATIRTKEGIILVVSFWTILSLFATIPFMFVDGLNIGFSSAFFEAISGLSTTGATIINNLDELPKSILYYRQQLQWLGGMGIVVLAVAILPMFGVGSMELFHAEASSISKDRATPKLAQTAKMLWFIYITLTAVCAVAYFLAGMDIFDAIMHSFSTIAIGGFSTHDDSIAYFNSANIEMVAVIFMVLAGINFSLHFMAIHDKKISTYFDDSEFKAYIGTLILLIVVVSFVLIFHHYYNTAATSIRHSVFQAVSIMTTTGFSSQNFSLWPSALPALLIFASFIGACAGSTGGGIKVVRVLLMFKLASREMKQLIHPSAQVNIKLNKRKVKGKILMSVWGFFSLYVISFSVVMVLLMFSGLDQVTSFSATAASLNNLGPGLGEVANNYSSISDFAKWVLSFAMLLGRLEILTLLVLFHRTFWRF